MMLVKESGALMSPSKGMMEIYVGAVLYMGSQNRTKPVRREDCFVVFFYNLH